MGAAEIPLAVIVTVTASAVDFWPTAVVPGNATGGWTCAWMEAAPNTAATKTNVLRKIRFFMGSVILKDAKKLCV
jgi:hypothetical protein